MPKTGNWGNKVIQVLKKNDDLPKRDKRKCRYYRKEDSYCVAKSRRCSESTYCDIYDVDTVRFPNERRKVVSSESSAVVTEASRVVKCCPIKPKLDFKGTRYINFEDIYVDNASFKAPNTKKVEDMVKYYEDHGELDRPIYVSCDNKQYYLKDKYLRYYTARKLGLKSIAAKIDDGAGNKLDNALRTPGNIVRFSSGEIGVVIAADLMCVTLKKENGNEIKMGIDYCIENNILTIK